MSAQEALEGGINWSYAVQLGLAAAAFAALVGVGIIVWQIWKETK